VETSKPNDPFDIFSENVSQNPTTAPNFDNINLFGNGFSNNPNNANNITFDTLLKGQQQPTQQQQSNYMGFSL
jgi:hypothetical protein